MIGIQMYTVRSLTETAEGAEKTVGALKKIGYEAIQLAGSIEVMENCAAAAKKCGVRVIGILTGTDLLRESYDRIIGLARDFGCYDIGISGNAGNEAEAKELVSEANSLAERINAEGFSFSYHNHSHEFIRTESGESVMDILLGGFCGVRLMPDTYWLQHGGVDVRDFIETGAERIGILHVKDMKRTSEGVAFAEVGEGNLNMRGIIKTARSVGIKDFVVEQDECDGDPIESARISFENIKRILED